MLVQYVHEFLHVCRKIILVQYVHELNQFNVLNVNKLLVTKLKCSFFLKEFAEQYLQLY